MKKILSGLVVSFIILFLISCSEEEKRELKIENIDAFAYYVEDYWELNTSVIVSGFHTEENEDNYAVKLSYYINLISPSGELIEEVDYGIIDETVSEPTEDVNIEVQLYVDEGFETGKYKMIFHINDDLSMNEAQDTTTFMLESD